MKRKIEKGHIGADQLHAVPLLNLSEKQNKFFDITWKPALNVLHTQFHINRLEEYREHLNFPFPPHRQTVSDFIFLIKGKSRRSKGLDNFDFGEHQFFFLPAYQISTHEYMSMNVKGFYCHFDDALFNRKGVAPEVLSDFPYLQFIGNPVVTVNKKSQLHILNILERLQEEYTKSTIPDLDIISMNLLALFYEVKQYCRLEKVSENSSIRIAQLYKNKLAQHIYEKHSVAEFATMLNVSPNHLNKCIKTATGKTAQYFLSEMILLEAKVLLRQTTLSVNEIAWKIGREDASDFIRFFKSRTGLTPTEFRKAD